MRYVLIGGLALFAVMVFSIVDILAIDRSRVRHLPKVVWVVLVIFLSAIGSRRSRPRGPLGPDDDPEFLRRIAHDQEREERIRKLEEKLAELDDDNPKD